MRGWHRLGNPCVVAYASPRSFADFTAAHLPGRNLALAEHGHGTKRKFIHDCLGTSRAIALTAHRRICHSKTSLLVTWCGLILAVATVIYSGQLAHLSDQTCPPCVDSLERPHETPQQASFPVLTRKTAATLHPYRELQGGSSAFTTANFQGFAHPINLPFNTSTKTSSR